MNVREYLVSGIVESYVMGLATTEEKREFEVMMSLYPELVSARRAFETGLEEFANSRGVTPPFPVKVKVFERAMDAPLTPERIRHFSKYPEGINDLTSRQFEELAAILLRHQGYEVTLTQATRDGGKDLIVAHHTGFGQFLYFVECKKYGPAHKVGVEVLRQLYGAVAHDNITAGILVTNSYFTQDALRWQRDVCYRLKLVDRSLLLQWLAEYSKGGSSSKKIFWFF
ncbi:MAG TPA: restriction endonuclease [Puia sp.]|nr:restriction endonuclease [Puia sp.]